MGGRRVDGDPGRERDEGRVEDVIRERCGRDEDQDGQGVAAAEHERHYQEQDEWHAEPPAAECRLAHEVAGREYQRHPRVCEVGVPPKPVPNHARTVLRRVGGQASRVVSRQAPATSATAVQPISTDAVAASDIGTAPSSLVTVGPSVAGARRSIATPGISSRTTPKGLIDAIKGVSTSRPVSTMPIVYARDPSRLAIAHASR